MLRVRPLVVFAASQKFACLALAFLIPLYGCDPAKHRFGQGVSLATTPLISMQAGLAGDPAIAPGRKSPLIVTFTAPDGSVFVTEGSGKGTVPWKDIAITAGVVSVNKNGIVSLPRDPIISDGKLGHLVLTVPSHPSLRTELDIPLRYNTKFAAYFYGSHGFSGSDGTNGIDGTSGLPGYIGPDHPTPGGDGTDGSDGANGQDGRRGEDGPPIHVRVTLRSGSLPLLEVGVSAPGSKEQFYLVDPNGGSLTVASEGGSGGLGGKGGRGGRGGPGGIGYPNGRNGRDGLNGHDGLNGSQGNDGTITVTYDPQAKPFLSTIHSKSSQSTIFKEEPVAPLW